MWKWLFLDMSTTMYCGSPDACLWYLRPLQESEVMTAATSGVLNLLHLFERELGTKNLRPDHLENAVRRNKSNSLKQGKFTLVSLSWLNSDFYAILTCLSVFPYCTLVLLCVSCFYCASLQTENYNMSVFATIPAKRFRNTWLVCSLISVSSLKITDDVHSQEFT